MAQLKKILVTGGCGYIGSHTVVELLRLNEGCEVVVADNLVKSRPESLGWIEAASGKKVNYFYKVDLCSYESVQKIFEEHHDIEVVIHFAALKSVPESVAMPLWYYRNNLVSLLNLLEVSQRANVKSFIFSSSCSLYGNVSQLPVNEHTPLGVCESSYAHTKLVGEEMIKSFSSQSRFKSLSLRYFNPVGADKSGEIGESPIDKANNVLPVITQTASGLRESMTIFGGDYPTRDGSCVRDYIHVSDIARAHILAMYHSLDSQDNKYDVFNLGSGSGVSVLELVSAFEKFTGMKINYEIGPRREGDVAAIYSDCSKAEKKLGWIPENGIEQMVQTAWKWQLKLNSLLSN
jgi:UDP-glucose 4-epimerase